MITSLILSITLFFGGVFGFLVREEPRPADPVEIQVVLAGEWRCLTTADGAQEAQTEMNTLREQGFEVRIPND